MLKIYAFSPNFPLVGSVIGGILLVIFLKFQGNKASTVFYDTALFFIIYPQYTENTGFLSNSFAYGLHGWGILSVIPLGF